VADKSRPGDFDDRFAQPAGAALVAALVSACGVRGPLKAPPGAEDEPRDPPFILDPLVD
jgi:predicted small lipoprotein YifL